MGWIVAVIILIVSIILLRHKQVIDISNKVQYEQQVQFLQTQKFSLQSDIDFYEEKAKKLQEQITLFDQMYQDKVDQQDAKLLAEYEKNKQYIQQQKNDAEALLAAELEKEKNQCQNEINIALTALDSVREDCSNTAKSLQVQTEELKEKFNALLAPIRLYDMEQQQKLYYTIQIPEEYHNDIDYLLTSVSQKIQHPDIISKLIWAEYIKPAMDDTIKRVGIEDKSGIYKITSILNGKCYIGKSTNIKKRLQDHFKSSVGINSIADQAIHHAILKEGIWNWTIEPVIYAEKDKLNELEKYYIEFFKAQEYGYNKTGGG